MELKPYHDFARALSPLVRQVSRKHRDILLKKMYSFAIEKLGLEDHKSDHTQTQMLRERRLEFSRIRARIRNAAKELMLAHSIHPALSRQIAGIPSVIEKLRETDRKLETTENVAATLIHPEVRTMAERTMAQKAPISLSLSYPEMKGAAIDYRFVSNLDASLDALVSSGDLILAPSKRNEIISKAFDAAFGVAYTASNAKTTLSRLKDRSALNIGRSQVQKS
jgi:hypothetical protein